MSDRLSGVWLRVRHKLTAHHWRHNRCSNGTTLGICSCGWHARFLRRVQWTTRWRKVTRLCWLRGHVWGERNEMHTGPVGFEESEDTFMGANHQCDRCYEIEDVA